MSKLHCPARARHRPVLATALAVLLAASAPALAITYGEPDGNAHPYVGSLVVRLPGGGVFQWCTGTLIDARVFLTASHCTVDIAAIEAEIPGAEFLVTFDPVIDDAGTFYDGTPHTHPDFGSGGENDPSDVAVIVLDQAPPIASASLPSAGMLDALKADHSLLTTRFTAVGYGAVRDSQQGGFTGILDNLDRNRAEQDYRSLTPAWLTLAMTPSNGNGGTCYGDSGGPHFLHLAGGETDIVASITVTGDAPCKAMDRTYRVDTPAARAFLSQFVTLP